jgi:hypothetical protein
MRIRAQNTKNRLERMVPYSAATGVLLSAYLAHRAAISRARGRLFLSESRRNYGQQIVAGGGDRGTEQRLAWVTCQLLLINRRAFLHGLTEALLSRVRRISAG